MIGSEPSALNLVKFEHAGAGGFQIVALLALPEAVLDGHQNEVHLALSYRDLFHGANPRKQDGSIPSVSTRRLKQ